MTDKFDINRRTPCATEPDYQLVWFGLVYPNHQLMSSDGMFGIYGADTVNGAPYGSYVIAPNEPYIPVSLIWICLDIIRPRPTTLIDCINECETLWRMCCDGLPDIIEPTAGYRRTRAAVELTYHEALKRVAQ